MKPPKSKPSFLQQDVCCVLHTCFLTWGGDCEYLPLMTFFPQSSLHVDILRYYHHLHP